MATELEVVKIQVVRVDGRHETLTLTAPVTVREHVVITGTGMEHFFLDDGRYDGWGMPLGDGLQGTEEDAFGIAEAIESDREIGGE